MPTSSSGATTHGFGCLTALGAWRENVFAAGAAFYLYVINDFGLLPIQKLCACVAFLAFGYYAHNVYITNVAQKRRESIVAAFPDALDLLLICVESGMSIEAAIQKVGAEVVCTKPSVTLEKTFPTFSSKYKSATSFSFKSCESFSADFGEAKEYFLSPPGEEFVIPLYSLPPSISMPTAALR